MTKRLNLRWTPKGWEGMFENTPSMYDLQGEWLPTGFTTDAYDDEIMAELQEYNPTHKIVIVFHRPPNPE